VRDFAGARRDADEILAQNTEAFWAVRLMVDSYAAENKSSLAIQRLREMVAVHPKSAPLQHALGEALLASGHCKDSRSAFESAVAANPGFVTPRSCLWGLWISKIGGWMPLAPISPPRWRPGNITALSATGDIELRAGDDSAALDKYRAGLDVDPDNVPA